MKCRDAILVALICCVAPVFAAPKKAIAKPAEKEIVSAPTEPPPPSGLWARPQVGIAPHFGLVTSGLSEIFKLNYGGYIVYEQGLDKIFKRTQRLGYVPGLRVESGFSMSSREGAAFYGGILQLGPEWRFKIANMPGELAGSLMVGYAYLILKGNTFSDTQTNFAASAIVGYNYLLGKRISVFSFLRFQYIHDPVGAIMVPGLGVQISYGL